MKRKLGTILSVAVLAGATFLGWQAAYAQGPGGGPGAGGPPPQRFQGPGEHGPFGGRFLRRLADRLELTEQQREQVQGILQAERSANEALHEELQANREALREASQFGAFFTNEAEITALAQRQGELHAQMIVSHERVKAQFFEILTPEQQNKLRELAQLMEDFGGGRRHHRGH